MFSFCDEDLVRYVALAREQLAALRRGEGAGSGAALKHVSAGGGVLASPSTVCLPSAPPLCALAHIRHFHGAYCRLAFSRLHLWSCLRHDLQSGLAGVGDPGIAGSMFSAPALALRRGVRLALAAPRGSAKSTIHSLLLPVIDVVQRRERYIVIVSATLAQAQGRLRSLRRELLENEALARAYPFLREGAAGGEGGRGLDGKFAATISVPAQQSACAFSLPQRAMSAAGLSTAGAGAPPIPPPRATRSALVVNGVRIEACGARCELRGLSWGEFRPTKIILDDAEASAAALTPHGRAATARWFAEVIEYLGDRYTHVEVVGTLLHPRSLLAELLKRPDFEAVHCAAVEQWSAATALWDEWRRLLMAPGGGRAGDEDGAAAETALNDHASTRRAASAPERGAARARRFFLAHRAEMLAGTRVLWKAREDYAALMTQLALGGRAAFFKEKQNQPGGGDLQLFDVARALRFEVRNAALWPVAAETETLFPADSVASGQSCASGPDASGPSCPSGPYSPSSPAPQASPAKPGTASPVAMPTSSLDVFGFLDPALGHDPARGDYAAIAVVGRDAHGLLYVLDLWMQRVAVPAQLDAVFHLHEAWGFREFGFESNHFQEVLAYELQRRREERRMAGKGWWVPIRMVRHREAKAARIDRLQGLVASGLLRFNMALPQEFFAQMEDYPHGRHDDGLDALAAAVTLAGEGGRAGGAGAAPRRGGYITVGRGEMVRG